MPTPTHRERAETLVAGAEKALAEAIHYGPDDVTGERPIVSDGMKLKLASALADVARAHMAIAHDQALMLIADRSKP